MFHPEAISLHNDDATLTLYDAEKVLDKGTINKHFQDTKLREVIEYIVEKSQDPNNAIVGINHPSETVQDLSVHNGGQFGTGGWIGSFYGYVTETADFFGNPEFANTSLKFKKITPFEALKKTASAFALQTWVDKDGYLNYGLRGMYPNSYTLDTHGERGKIKEYNVTVGSGKLSQIILRGRYEYITNTRESGPKERTSPNVYAYGKAWLVDEDGNPVPGRTLEPEEPIGATNPDEVEDTARRHLLQHYMGRKNGNIVINAGASEDKPELTGIAIGDLLFASAEIEEHCKREVDTGIFMVQSVQHKLDRRRGWLVDIGVAALPASDIGSESWLENAKTDQKWDSVDDYPLSDFDT